MRKIDPEWYKDRELLRAAKDEYGTLAGAARAIGGADKSTLGRWWNKHRLDMLTPGPDALKVEHSEALQRLYQRVYG